MAFFIGGVKMDTLRRIALALVIIGAINWGLIGLFNFDLVAFIFNGQQSLLSRIIYTLVGLSGLYAISLFFTHLNPVDDSTVNSMHPAKYSTESSDDLNYPDEG